MITQEALDQHHNEKIKISFLLFDEIEKASESLWQLLLGMLDKATLTLGDNRRVDLSRTMIFMTSNLGGREIANLMTNRLGFASTVRSDPQYRMNEKVERTASEAARRKFAPEFMNRIDKLVVFHPLRVEQLQRILDIELQIIQQRVLEAAAVKFVFQLTQEARTFLLSEGTNLAYGARHLKRTIERHVVCPLARLVATDQVQFGDVISIDWEGTGSELQFEKKAQGAQLDVTSLAELTTGVNSSSFEGHAPSVFVSKATVTENARMEKMRGSVRMDAQRGGVKQEISTGKSSGSGR